MIEQVILVDKEDRPIGFSEKLEVHRKGLLHRAFSVFVFNSKNELLLQRRAEGKYHSAGLWTNTCCSHPKPHESTLSAAKRRLREEMGIVCNLIPVFQFSYLAALENGLIENELDHVFFGKSDQLPVPNAEEAQAYKYRKLDFIEKDIISNPEQYTVWFKLCFKKMRETYSSLVDVE